ncbi:hypothetical protein [Enterobacter asburiae]|uniref:hypothetical protein n=1 Tax=Enterobacter asburiae TaxID=61645 RepID=UPI0015F5D254|nr:hypothetical protein [Enterobacter asburiae]
MFVKGMEGTVGMGHKKARRACAVRAFRTSSVDSGDRRWRILVLAGVEPASEISTYHSLYKINSHLLLKTAAYSFAVLTNFMRF